MIKGESNDKKIKNTFREMRKALIIRWRFCMYDTGRNKRACASRPKVFLTFFNKLIHK